MRGKGKERKGKARQKRQAVINIVRGCGMRVVGERQQLETGWIPVLDSRALGDRINMLCSKQDKRNAIR